MNIYIETNFVLELALIQEEQEACEELLKICENKQPQLILPAYSLVEPYETLIRRDRDRKELARILETELNQLSRTVPYKTKIESLREITNLLIRSGSEEAQRLIKIREKLLNIAEIVPLNKEILLSAQNHQIRHGLSPQDSIVYASVLWHLNLSRSDKNCFLNRNVKDFGDPDIKNVLDTYDCRVIFSFSDGLSYVQSQID